jgi:hypothetical protein
MHPPSQRNRTIGIVGLVWFLWCASSAAFCVLDMQDFRDWSHFSWTDREIYIGAACYMTCGLAGLLLAFTRLILPAFARRPQIGYGVAAPLLAVYVQPRFDDFHTLNAMATTRTAITKTIITLLGGVVIFVLLEHPNLRHEGIPLRVGMITCGTILLAKAIVPILRALFSRSRLWSKLRWSLYGRHREPRRYHVFEDGILVQGVTYHRAIPWYEVRYVHFFGNTIGLVGRGELITIPGEAIPSQDDANALIQLLDRKTAHSSYVAS